MARIQRMTSLDYVAKAIAKKPRTARQIADELHMSKPAIYALLKRLKDEGYQGRKVAVAFVRDGDTGPEAKAYHLS